jgi:cobalamin biosynthesis Mg chelatase CobN
MLSFVDLRDDIYERMLRDYNGIPPRPALHQPDQQAGDLTRLPVFPNAAWGQISSEEQRQAIEARRKAEEERQAIEARRKAEEERQAVEARRKAEEERQAVEARRKAEEERQAVEARRKAEEERQVVEARRKAEEEQKATEARRSNTNSTVASAQSLPGWVSIIGLATVLLILYFSRTILQWIGFNFF